MAHSITRAANKLLTVSSSLRLRIDLRYSGTVYVALSTRLHVNVSTEQMWAMCLLYLGKLPPLGVERDYRLSPILAPSSLLAELPPLLLQCGARDPLVDDTVLFGGRVRAAKREHARLKRENEDVDLPTPPGEGTIPGEIPEEDVTVQIFPGWSHGYLQMSVLMPSAKVAINDIADWISATFERSRVSSV